MLKWQMHLEIGNSNWAIKEGELLGYNRVGNDYLPIPITMTRASLGTRVNPEGLVEDVALLGIEELTDGGFPTGTTAWYEGTGWSLGNGYAESDGTNAPLEQYNALEIGKQYKVVITVIGMTASPLSVRLGTSSSNQVLSITSDGTYTAYGTAGNTTFRLRSQGFNGKVTDVSVKEATIENLARVDYTDGTSSLLVEPQRTNTVTYSEDYTVTYSEDFSQFSTLGSPTLTTGQLAPDGTLSATKVSGTIGSTYLALSGTTSATATRTIYAKTVSGTGTARLMSYYGNTDNLFNLTEEWQRFELTGAISTGAANFYVDMRGTQTLSEFIVWGGQSEEATYATSYIPTSGGTVTRVQETYEKTGISDLINSEEGVLFFEMAALSDDGTLRCITLSDGGTTNRVLIIYDTQSNSIRAVVVSNAGTSFDELHTVTSTLDFHKIAIKWKLNDFALWIDGVEVATDTSGAAPIGLDRIVFDVGNGTYDFYGKVKQLQIFKTALTDDELTILTGTSGVHFYTSYAAMASGLTYKIE